MTPIVKDPFQRLNELIADRFPEGAPSIKHELHIGNPKGPTNTRVRDLLVQNLDIDAYHPLRTLPELKDAIIQYNQRVHGVKLSREQVSAVQGTKSALAWIPATFLGKCRESALIPDLSYPVYYTAAQRTEAGISFYSADADLREKLPLFGARYMIINSPHNPLGRVLKTGELEHLAKEAQEKDFILVSDECYIDIYSNKKPTSLLEVDKTGEFRNLLVLNSLSKSANVPGLRSGFVAGDARLVKQFADVYATTGNTLSVAHQRASVLAWTDFEFISKNKERYQEALRHFSSKTGPPVPEGAFYFFVNTGRDGEEFALDMIRQHGIKLMPGKYLDFRGSGRWDKYVRIPVAEKLDDDVIGALKNGLAH